MRPTTWPRSPTKKHDDPSWPGCPPRSRPIDGLFERSTIGPLLEEDFDEFVEFFPAGSCKPSTFA
jgi:hypothetical protein